MKLKFKYKGKSYIMHEKGVKRAGIILSLMFMIIGSFVWNTAIPEFASQAEKLLCNEEIKRHIKYMPEGKNTYEYLPEDVKACSAEYALLH